MSTVPDSACGREPGCGRGLGVLSLKSSATSLSGSYVSAYHSTDTERSSHPPVSSKLNSSASSNNSGILNGTKTLSNVRSNDCSSKVVEQSSQDSSVVSSNGAGRSAEMPKLHRIAEVRKSQGLSERSFCKRLNIDLQKLRELEDPHRDLSISELMQVQAALEVPLAELLEDSNSLARPIQERAKLVRIMKTVAAIEESPLATRPKRLVTMLREQMVELMPELAEVGSWPQFGSRRSASSVARVLEQEINLSQIPSAD